MREIKMAAANTIRLNEFLIGERKLRFFEWRATDLKTTAQQGPQDGIPLFLGADVLSRCSLAVCNLPRMHAKFAKQGLAIKVNFPSTVRLFGIHGTARGVWFYSVQGLFRVCFEYYTREEQLDCLNQFCTTWKRRFPDPPLPREIDIDVSNLQVTDPQCLNSPVSGESSSLNSEFSCTMKDASQGISQNELTTEMVVETIKTDCITSSEKSKVVVSAFVKEVVHLYEDDNIPECDSFVVTMARLMEEFKVQKSTNNGSTPRTLIAVSKYLGEEFNKLHNEIVERATDFKKRHITSIDCLPPASTLVEELFPDCMQILLLTWMGSENRPTHIYSIVQVILELANMSLISGVAHVLYSRLIRTDTV